MPVTKNYTDTFSYFHQTYVELIEEVTKDFDDNAYMTSSCQVANISTTGDITRNYDDNAFMYSECELAFETSVEYEDWTTMTLVENPNFSEFPSSSSSDAQIPRFWEGGHGLQGLEIKKDSNYFLSEPSSVQFLYAGSEGLGALAWLKQTIKVTDIQQTSGMYRLLFYYQSSTEEIQICPYMEFLDEDGYQLSRIDFNTNQASTATSAWKVFDEQVEFDTLRSDIKYIRLVLQIQRLADGAFIFRIDDVDFHYGFDLDTAPNKIPSYPSAVPLTVSKDFGRTSDRTAYIKVLGDGNVKRRGTLTFNLIPETQLKHMKAAWAFQKGHRINIQNTIAHRVNVTMPQLLEFYWVNDFTWTPASSLENLFNMVIDIEEK